MKLMDMYQNSRNKMLAAPGQRAILYGNSKENFMVDKYMDSYEMHKQQNVEEGRYFMNYFYDIDQSNIEEIKDYLHGGAGIKPYRGGMTDFSAKAASKTNLGLLSQNSPRHLKQPLSTLDTNFSNACNNNNVSHKRPLKTDLNDDALKTNVQIVLQNINNALLTQKQPTQKELKPRHNNLNIFAKFGQKIMSSPADCDSTNNNNMLGCSIASSQDFTHDNSDYQWFVDYGYRDGVQHQSILSSLSASYNGIGELSYYEDMAKNLDANLAEVDMENFRSEDINSLLTTIDEHDGKNANSFSNRKKLILKDQAEFDTSICKSELLFSPVKESHISVDSLDMSNYPDDGDIILTCQANKNNYTIAFEGSYLYSDDSYYADVPDNGKLKQNSINVDEIVTRKKPLDISMTQSDTGLTTWRQLKKTTTGTELERYPSGNNNIGNPTGNLTQHAMHCAVRKSTSMPNLKEMLEQAQQLNVSQVMSNASMDSISKLKTMLPMLPINSEGTESNGHQMNNSSISNNEKVPPSFNLVKLFIKQKSSSTDTCMDVSSGCWPSDSTNSSGDHSNNNNLNINGSLSRLRKKSMNDSGKGSALSRHEEDADEYQCDSLDPAINNTTDDDKINKTNDFNREIFDSPTHKRHYKEYNLNIRNQQLKHPALYNLMNNNSITHTHSSNSDTSRTSENLTQILNKEEEQKRSIPIEMITKSIQTSMMQPKEMMAKSQVKMVPPSFLAHLSKLGDQQKAPVYVIYPNYALPDLEFIQHQPPKMQKDILISPMDYKLPFSMARTMSHKQHQLHLQQKKRRPQSLNLEKLGDYKHVSDWKSLLTLLPRDYRKLLKHVPEVNQMGGHAMEGSMASQKPMFCMTPPIRRTQGMTCDCAHLLQQNNQEHSSSSGGSSQPPSSGYRGSSTMLTDSEVDMIGVSNEHLKNMYVYQYENEESKDQRPPSGRRGILRRTNTTNNAPLRTNSATTKPKRYSMFEQQNLPPYQVQVQAKVQMQQDKRRSLQEPNFYNGSELEDYVKHHRLPNYMKSRDSQTSEHEKDLNQIITEMELNKALSSKLNNFTGEADIQDIEARLRAENFLSSIPKSELKHYAEIANLMEWTANDPAALDRSKLRNEVSRALSSRKVSFNQQPPSPSKTKHLLHPNCDKKFATPPNSPSMSINAQKVEKRQLNFQQQQRLEKEKQDKIQSNRFKRLQIQWEILSKDAAKDFEEVNETKSGGSTPSGSSSKAQSKIPRPVSYPNSKQSPDFLGINKNLRSPSRLITPKKYTTTTPTNNIVTSPTTGVPRTPTRLHTTPKKTLPARSATRTR